ncbi:MAG: crossover junction endodeoxyribonuclease RuvC [Flavobacteriales bacterium]|jgi:crossover junction endodeoxyribonuclease RuvC
MALVLGIDPGSRKTGFGIINVVSGRHEYIASGVIRVDTEPTLPERLNRVFEGVCQVIEKYAPDEFAIESVFMSKSAGSALKLGQARGAAIVAATSHGLPVAEYEARKVKQAVVGTGAADKTQVQHMVMTILKLSKCPQEDAADALAIALCHAQTQQQLIKLAGSKQFRRGRIV